MSSPLLAYSSGTPTSRESAIPIGLAFHIAGVTLAFLAFYFLIVPVEGADTVRYAADAVKHASGVNSQFWEFGHLLWRPIAYVGFSLFGVFFRTVFQDTDLQAASRFLIILNFFASLGAVLLLWDWIRRFTSVAMASCISVAFIGANGFLQQISLGSAYVPAVFVQILSLWLLMKASQSRPASVGWSAAAGLSFALSTMLWFPFAISLVGVALSPLLGMSVLTSWRERREVLSRLLLPFFAVLVPTVMVGFVAGATRAGIYDVHAFAKWAVDANNGWSQSMNVVRAATGFPRSFYELTADGVLLKRRFLHDPFQPVSLVQLAMGPMLKLSAFYLGMLGFLVLLARAALRQRLERTSSACGELAQGSRVLAAAVGSGTTVDFSEAMLAPATAGQAVAADVVPMASLLLVLGAALIPLIFFALVVFETGAAVRYLPGFAFLFAGIAVVLHQTPRLSAPSFSVILLLISAPIANLIELGTGMRANAAEVRTQKAQVEAALTRPATVFALTLHEPFYVIPISRPLDHSLWSPRFEVRDLIEQASTRTLHWRGEFAETTLINWQAGKEVWIPASVLAAAPPHGSSWVEGDDKRINWSQIHAFFTQILTDRSSGGPGGFVRVADQPANRELFAQLEKQDTPDPQVIH